ncbi:MAG: hypothetical protein HY717_20940 [Planctomycetes bacterium]|nr:hypothetical protein [Planctomycetota bacterium]
MSSLSPVSPLFPKSLENPQRVRQIDVRMDLPPDFLRLRADGPVDLPGLNLISPSFLSDGLLEAVFTLEEPAAVRKEFGGGTSTLEAPSLRRRLDAAFETCNRGVASWIGDFFNGLFRKP